MTKIRPRSLERYSEEIKVKARELYLEWAFLTADHWKEAPFLSAVRAGDHDDVKPLEAIAWMLDEQSKRIAGVRCTGCGSGWTDEHLKAEKARRPELRSCCPEREALPVAWVCQ